ncbi:MAG: hypothetical protein WD579_00405 [Candidatus Paceibacterota bacterium]
MEQTQPTNGNSHDNHKALTIGVAVIVLLVAVFLIFGNRDTGPTEQDEVTPENQEEEVVLGDQAEDAPRTIEEVDLTSTEGLERLPEGFPSDTPVDVETLVDSTHIVNEDGSEESLVVYLSDATIGELYESYISYIDEQGFEIDRDDSTDEFVIMNALRENTTMSVSATPSEEGGQQEVFVRFLVE